MSDIGQCNDNLMDMYYSASKALNMCYMHHITIDLCKFPSWRLSFFAAAALMPLLFPLISLNNDFLIFILIASVNRDNALTENEQQDKLGKWHTHSFCLINFTRPTKRRLNLTSYNCWSLGTGSLWNTFVYSRLSADWWSHSHSPIGGTQIFLPLGSRLCRYPGELQNKQMLMHLENELHG